MKYSFFKICIIFNQYFPVFHYFVCNKLFYFRLQDEYNRLEEEIKRTIEESKIVQDKYKTMYEDSRKEVAERHAQVEELRNKVRNYAQGSSWALTVGRNDFSLQEN